MKRICILPALIALASLAVYSAAAEANLPAIVKRLLDATETQAAIPLYDYGYAPQTDLLFAAMGDPMGVGSIGQISSFKVLQVIDDENMRVTLRWKVPHAYKVVGPRGAEFFQLDEVEADVWLESFSTRGVVDDASYAPNGDRIFEVIGTKRYETALGQRTVLRVTPLDVSAYRDYFTTAMDARKRKVAESLAVKETELKREHDAKNAAIRAQEEERLSRTWTDSTGAFSLKAAYAGLKRGGIVVLKKADGTTIDVKSSQLSRQDREWIRDVGSKLIPLVE